MIPAAIEAKRLKDYNKKHARNRFGLSEVSIIL